MISKTEVRILLELISLIAITDSTQIGEKRGTFMEGKLWLIVRKFLIKIKRGQDA